MPPGIVLCGSLSRWAVSLGAAMHEAGYRAVGLPWRYVPFEIDAARLEGAVAAMRALGIRGLGVSMPFKRDVMRSCDRLDPVAERIGAVNTLVNEDGLVVGHNTDWLGAARALEEAGSLDGRRALVLGAGGAARAVAFGLAERGARVSIANRTEARAAELASAVGGDVVAWTRRQGLFGFDVLVNATSLGMSTIETRAPVEAAALHPGLVVMDIVYKPIETELVRMARDAGARPIHGGRMLLHQAAAQFEIYTGHPAPLAAMDAALRAELGA